MTAIVNNLLNNMTYITMSLIAFMLIIFLIGVINNIILKIEYSKIIKELDNANNDGMEVYKNKMLNEIVSSYKEAYLKSYDGVNTQAIIESKFSKSEKGKIGKEDFLKGIIPMLLTLGIVGTLYNIIVIVMELTSMLKNVDAGTTPSMLSIMGDMSTIFSYLAIAFVTAFVAVLTSFLYTVINSMTHVELERNILFARIENYLDNILGANLSQVKPKMLGNDFANANILYALKNTNDSMIETTSRLQSTLKSLTNNIQDVIKENETNNDNNRKNRMNSINTQNGLNAIYNIDLDDDSKEDEARRIEKLKQIEESKKAIEEEANKKLESMKYSDVIPNKNKVYVKEVEIDEKEYEKEKNQNRNQIQNDIPVMKSNNNIVMPKIQEINNYENLNLNENKIINEKIITNFQDSKKVDDIIKSINESIEENETQKIVVNDNVTITLPRSSTSIKMRTPEEIIKEVSTEVTLKNQLETNSNDLVNNNESNNMNTDSNTNVNESYNFNEHETIINQLREKQKEHALTMQDIELLKQELIKKQEEDKKIQELMQTQKNKK